MFYMICLLMILVTADAFLFMMEKGATLKSLNFKTTLIHGLIFGVVNMAIFGIGFTLSRHFLLPRFIKFQKFFSFLVLDVLSFMIFYRTLKRKPFIERVNQNYSYKDSLYEVLLTSVDTLLLSMTLANYAISLPSLLILSFVTTFIIVIIALSTGYHFGAAYQSQIGYICAILYFILAQVQLFSLFCM